MFLAEVAGEEQAKQLIIDHSSLENRALDPLYANTLQALPINAHPTAQALRLLTTRSKMGRSLVCCTDSSVGLANILVSAPKSRWFLSPCSVAAPAFSSPPQPTSLPPPLRLSSLRNSHHKITFAPLTSLSSPQTTSHFMTLKPYTLYKHHKGETRRKKKESRCFSRMLAKVLTQPKIDFFLRPKDLPLCATRITSFELQTYIEKVYNERCLAHQFLCSSSIIVASST